MSNSGLAKIRNLVGVDDNIIKIFLIRVFHTTSIILATYIIIMLKNANYSKEETGLISAIIGISYVPMSIIAGVLSDRLGRKVTFNFFKIITIVLLSISLFLNSGFIMHLLLIIVVCINNGLEPVIVSTAIDFSKEKERKNTFAMLQLGTSIGMAGISLVASSLFDLNYKLFFTILLIFSIASTMLLKNLYKNYIPKKKESKKKQDKKKNYIKIDTKNKTLIIFSIILITFSIASSQLTYGLTYKVEAINKSETEKWVGLLSFIYYSAFFIFNLVVSKITKKNSCIVNIIIAGIIYTIGMALIAFNSNIILICCAMCFWATAQLLININNGLFIAENSDENNRGTYNAIFTIISGSGTVLGPLLSGYILGAFGLFQLWSCMVLICFVGTMSIYGLYYFKKKNAFK
jgi:MFS family permease